MTNFKSGDIVLIEVIFSEQNESKKRPALIISTDEYNKNRKDIIIAAITSNTSRILLGDTLIDDWKKSGLLSSSLITATIQTIKNDMIIKKLGSLSKTDFETVKYNLKKAIIQWNIILSLFTKLFSYFLKQKNYEQDQKAYYTYIFRNNVIHFSIFYYKFKQ